jgi:lysophospholipase L1-like esterase
MKLIMTVCILMLIGFGSQAQVAPVSACTSPATYNFDEEVSWYYDFSGNDLAVPGDTLYFWSWEPNTPPGGAAPMIWVKEQIWKLTWKPTEYYGVDLSVIVNKGNGAFWHTIQDVDGNTITGTIPFAMKEQLRLGTACDCIGQPSDESNLFLVNFTNNASTIPDEDANGNNWTNVSSGNGSFSLLDTGNVHRYDISTSGAFIANNNSDFSNPDAAKLGQLAESNATVSYLYLESGNVGEVSISCLEPNHTYKLSILGSRNTTSERITTYSVKGATTVSGNLQTSGTGLGSGACTDCNDDELFEATVNPDLDGRIAISVETNGSFAFINAMKIEESIPDLKPITSISVSGADINTPGGTSQMTVAILPEDATNKAVKWTVEPTNIASISEAGLLTAKGNGTVKVTATSVDGSGIFGSADIFSSNQLYSLQQVFLIDFGNNSNQTNSPDSRGNHWTNFIDGQTQSMTNSEGTQTAFEIYEDSVVGSYPANNGGLSAPGDNLGMLALSSVTEDYFTSNNPDGALFYIDNLDPDKIYKFTIFGTRQSTTGRITRYEINGATQFSEDLAVSGNRSKLVVSPYLFPNDTGAFTLHLKDVGDNDFVYIGGMMVEEVIYEGATASSVKVIGQDITVPGGVSVLNTEVTISGVGIETIDWSLSNDSIAYLSPAGVLYPKANGEVDVIATVAVTNGPSDTLTINITNQVLGDLYAFGDGLEGDPDGSSPENSIAMKQLTGAHGVLTGIFTTFSAVDTTGAFQFYHPSGDTAIYYGVDEAGQIVVGGSAIGPSKDWAGPVRLRVNLSEGDYEVVWDYKLVVKGNGTAGAWSGNGVALDYAGNGIWADTVDFTFADAENDTSAFRYYIESTDNYDNYRRYQKLAGSRNTLIQDFPEESGGMGFTTIDLNPGKYVISINLQDMSFNMQNTVQVEDGIAFMGSSVTAGYPVPTYFGPYKGYAYKYDSLLGQRFTDGLSQTDWQTVNISIGGNDTHDLDERFEENLVPSGMSYVWYGLALANQGILSAADKSALSREFLDGLHMLIADAREIGITPVVANSYPNGFYDDEYEYVIDANIEMAQWDVPTINFMGALDDGEGKWVLEYQARTDRGEPDSAHPNAEGYDEMFYSIVPSLFDALKADKPQPVKQTDKSLTIEASNSGKIYTFTSEGTVHSFTASVKVKTTGSGQFLSFNTGDSIMTISIDVADGTVDYASPAGVIVDGTMAINDDAWHTVALTHYYAAARTILYIDGKPDGEVSERIVETKMSLSSPEITLGTSFSNLLFYRSGMTEKEMTFVADDAKLLKSSLELYAPLDGTNELPLLSNLAQSMSVLRVGGVLNSDASLSDLRVNGESIAVFNAATTTYEISLPFGSTEIPEVTASKNDPFASFEINPTTELPGTTTVVVTAEDLSTVTYSVNFLIIAPRTDALLTDLTVEGSSIKGFDPSTFTYSVQVPYNQVLIPKVDATTNDISAIVEIIPTTDLPGITKVVVTAQDISVQLTYSVEFTLEAPAEDAALIDLTVDGETIVGFDPVVTEYNIELEGGTTAVPSVAGVTNDPNARILGDYATSVPGTTSLTVEAEDGTTKVTYTINFTMKVILALPDRALFVYPNPAENYLYINESNLSDELLIYDLSGSLKLRTKKTNGAIDVNSLESGVYLLKTDNQVIQFIKK